MHVGDVRSGVLARVDLKPDLSDALAPHAISIILSVGFENILA